MLKNRVINSRDTLQGDVFSQLLWNLVINKTLPKFSNKGIKVDAYADDVVLLIKVHLFPQ